MLICSRMRKNLYGIVQYIFLATYQQQDTQAWKYLISRESKRNLSTFDLILVKFAPIHNNNKKKKQKTERNRKDRRTRILNNFPSQISFSRCVLSYSNANKWNTNINSFYVLETPLMSYEVHDYNRDRCNRVTFFQSKNHSNWYWHILLNCQYVMIQHFY